jgi:Undecaprenyl-phosphate glucose phosphotransferase
MKRARVLYGLSLLAVDFTMSILAFFVAYLLRRWTLDKDIGPFADYLALASIQAVSTVLVFFFYKFYHRRRAALLLDEIYRLVGAVSVATLITVAFITFALRDQLEFQRGMMLLAWAAELVTITTGRAVHGRIHRWLQRRGVGAERVLIVGTGEVGRMILQKMQQTPGLGYQVVGFADTNGLGTDRVMGLPVLGHIESLPRVIEEKDIEEVIIGLPEATHQELVGIISQCEREKVSIRVFPDVFQIMASEVTISDLAGLPLLTIRDVALRGWKLTLKRIVDILFSSAFLITVSPVMLLTAILIKLDSHGPVFFVQERMGLDAKPFKMLKFRSMRVDAERLGNWTTKDDPRRTRIGSFLRKTSIDELPQFINVLMGDMSLVGPRPEQPSYVEQFRQSIPRYMERHREKAGITGWAQINGLRGDTSIAERTKYDLWYIENWSLWLDFKILIRTGLKALFDSAAY